MTIKGQFKIHDLVKVGSGFIAAYVTDVNPDGTVSVANGHGYAATLDPGQLTPRGDNLCPWCSPPIERNENDERGEPTTTS